VKRELLGLIRCPHCGGVDLALAIAEENASEIRAGRLECACGARFAITRGVVDLTSPGKELDEARAHAWRDVQQSSGLVHDDATLLGYDDLFRNLPPSEAHRYPYGIHLNLDRAMAEMELRPGMAVLDVGAGITFTSLRLARAGACVVATDLLAEKYAGLESAEVYFAAHGVYFERVLAPMDHMPFRDGTFDRVLFHAAIHHASDLEGTLRESARVLRPGGQVWIVNEPVGSLGGLFGGRFTREMEAAGEHVHTLAAYRRALRRAVLVPRILYPPGLTARLDALAATGGRWRATSRGQAVKYALVRAALALWRRSPIFRRLFERSLYFVALAIFGQFLLAEGSKPR
jgi:SAM-dependent methyltransferase